VSTMTPGVNLLIRLVLMAAVGPVILMFAAGDVGWGMGWVFAAFSFGYTLLSRLLVFRRNPDLIAERADSLKKSNVEPWDRALVVVAGLVLPTAMVLLAGLDRRFRWSPDFPVWIQAGAYLPMVLGAALAQWAVMENAFFSAVVRIQDDRGQTVVTTGPYRWIRHPGYAGGMLFTLFMPLALGSLWAFVPVFFSLVLTVVRTRFEDRTLTRKLPGYAEYAGRTRYRLIPGLW
jgi:protein-S-isoprenylcysteine O-methyltransferase Ste14